jgi:hypothetical protein
LNPSPTPSPLQRTYPQRVGVSTTSHKTLDANEIHFVNLVIDHLDAAGWMSAACLYESLDAFQSEGVFDSVSSLPNCFLLFEGIRLAAV